MDVKLVVTKCSACQENVALCVVNKGKAVCKACDRSGMYLKLSTYRFSVKQ